MKENDCRECLQVKPKSDIEPGSSDRGIWETCQLFGYYLLVFIYLLKNTISNKRRAEAPCPASKSANENSVVIMSGHI